MIFVTVGSLDPFDRLVEAVDQWCGSASNPVETLVQIGNGRYRPRHCPFVDFLTPDGFREKFGQARFVVSHAGMGTIITALELKKPMIVMPRRWDFREVRNDHQLATVRRFRRSEQIRVADSEADLHRLLNEFAAAPWDQTTQDQTTPATDWPPDPTLIDFIRTFIQNP